MQAVGRRVTAEVQGQRQLTRRQPSGQRSPIGRLLDQAASLEIGEQVHGGPP